MVTEHPEDIDRQTALVASLVLGFSEIPTERDALNARYREMMHRMHPDLATSESDKRSKTERAAAINGAYHVLCSYLGYQQYVDSIDYFQGYEREDDASSDMTATTSKQPQTENDEDPSETVDKTSSAARQKASLGQALQHIRLAMRARAAIRRTKEYSALRTSHIKILLMYIVFCLIVPFAMLIFVYSPLYSDALIPLMGILVTPVAFVLSAYFITMLVISPYLLYQMIHELVTWKTSGNSTGFRHHRTAFAYLFRSDSERLNLAINDPRTYMTTYATMSD